MLPLGRTLSRSLTMNQSGRAVEQALMATGWRIRRVVRLVSDCAAITALHSAQSDQA